MIDSSFYDRKAVAEACRDRGWNDLADDIEAGAEDLGRVVNELLFPLKSPLTLPTDHLSPSQIDTYRQCGERYRLRYCEGLKIPPRGAMLTGTGVHGGAAGRHRQRMQDDTEMPRRDVIDLSVSKFDERVDEEGIAEEPGRGKADVVDEARDDTATLAGGFSDLVAPQVMNPIAVEERVELDVESLGIQFVGVLDLAHVPEHLTYLEDLKCGSKKHGQADVDTSDQLTWYAMAWERLRGELPHFVGLRSLRELQAGPTQDLVVSVRTDDHIVKLLRIISNVLRNISKGSFAPAPSIAWWCSPEWCGYWRVCRYRGGK
jgi:hypothetical protein